MVEKLKGAVLLPTYDELGLTLDRSILNMALRMKEVQDIAWIFLIGVNGTDSEEEVSKVKNLRDAHSGSFNAKVEVHHYSAGGKENAMNQLARAARTHFGGWPDFIIGTDAKVYRTPNSLSQLVQEFREDDSLKIVGGSVLPYPIEIYREHFPLTKEQELFYTLLEIDKDEDVLEVFPKNHVRGGLYITSGEWQDLIVGIPDDFTLTRRARKEFGDESVKISKKATGYVIPRQSFADYFSVRFNRAMKHEENLVQSHPDLSGPKELPMSDEEKNIRYDQLNKIDPLKLSLLKTKKSMDSYVRNIINLINKSSQIHDKTRAVESLMGEYEDEIQSRGYSLDSIDMSLETIGKIALDNYEIAAKVIICHYKYIILSLATDPNSVTYGPREERFRGMLPLDTIS